MCPTPHIMEQKVSDKIIDDLKAINYIQILYLYDKNEPLMAVRMPELIKQASTSLPEAKIYIFSNGDLVTLELVKEYFDIG